MEYDNIDFLEAVKGYGELEHDDLMDITDDEPIIIDGKEVDSILDDDGLKFSYIENGVASQTQTSKILLSSVICPSQILIIRSHCAARLSL